MSWWSTASIRVRLTTWYTVGLSLMMVVYATATFVAVRHEFLEQLDDQLHDDFETAEGFLAPAPGGRIAWSSDRHHDPDNDEDRGSDVWSAGGEAIYRSSASAALPPVPEPAGLPLPPQAITKAPSSAQPRNEFRWKRVMNSSTRNSAGPWCHGPRGRLKEKVQAAVTRR